MVVGGVVDVAPAPWPEAPVVPGLPVPVAPAAPLWPLPVVPVELPSVAPLVLEPPVVEPVDELPPASLPLMPVALHAVKNSVTMVLMRMPRTVFMTISL